MHQTILAQRKAVAAGKLIKAAEAIGRHLEMDPGLVQAFHPAGIRDPQVKDMMIWEAAADLLVQLGILSGAIQEGVTAVTEEPAAIDDTQSEPPADDGQDETEPFDLDPGTPVSEPVIDEAPDAKAEEEALGPDSEETEPRSSAPEADTLPPVDTEVKPPTPAKKSSKRRSKK